MKFAASMAGGEGGAMMRQMEEGMKEYMPQVPRPYTIGDRRQEAGDRRQEIGDPRLLRDPNPRQGT